MRLERIEPVVDWPLYLEWGERLFDFKMARGREDGRIDPKFSTPQINALGKLGEAYVARIVDTDVDFTFYLHGQSDKPDLSKSGTSIQVKTTTRTVEPCRLMLNSLADVNAKWLALVSVMWPHFPEGRPVRAAFAGCVEAERFRQQSELEECKYGPRQTMHAEDLWPLRYLLTALDMSERQTELALEALVGEPDVSEKPQDEDVSE